MNVDFGAGVRIWRMYYPNMYIQNLFHALVLGTRYDERILYMIQDFHDNVQVMAKGCSLSRFHFIGGRFLSPADFKIFGSSVSMLVKWLRLHARDIHRTSRKI